MKSVGIVRKVDNLGRIVIPSEVRSKLKISDGKELEICMDEDSIVLKKYVPPCVFCGPAEHTIKFKGKILCKDCLDGLKNLTNIK